MKILAFAGSTSSTSINRELVKFVLKNFQEHEINLIDLNDFTMPVFSVDLEKKGFPDEAHNFLKQIEDKTEVYATSSVNIIRYACIFSSEESRGTVLKSQKEILCELNEKLPSQKKLYEELSMKRAKLLQEVQEEYENCLKSSSEMEKVMEERKKSYDAEQDSRSAFQCSYFS